MDIFWATWIGTETLAVVRRWEVTQTSQLRSICHPTGSSGQAELPLMGSHWPCAATEAADERAATVAATDPAEVSLVDLPWGSE